MANSNLSAIVHQTWERARSLRQDAQESRWLARAMKAHARQLHDSLQELDDTAQPAEIQPEIQPMEPTKPVRELFKANRRELLAELKQSLCDLENLRMTPQDDPAVRELSADIRKTIAQDTANSTTVHISELRSQPDRDQVSE